MERVDEPGEDAESYSSHRTRTPLRDDQPGAALEESKPDRWPSASSSASALSSASPPSAQLPGTGDEEVRPTATADPEQALHPAAQAGQHKLPQAERLADPRGTHARPSHADHGRHAAPAPWTRAGHATEPLPVELRASGGHGPRGPSPAQPCAQRLQAAAAGQTEDTQVETLRQRRGRLVLAKVGPWTVVR